MIDKALQEVAAEDLQRLHTNKVPESRSLEYKQSLPGGTDGERKEFLADVSSFANSVGGDLIYGVTEAREDGKPSGIPDSIDGLAGVNQDAETRRLENMLRDGIAPRLPSVQFHWVPGFPQGPVLLVRVSRSWAGPHMVVYQQHSRFYARNAAGKYPLDVFELRQAFLGSGSLRERAREFRSERLGRLVAGEVPVPLSSERYVCLHFIPHAALAGATDIDILLAAKQRDDLQPLYSASWGHMFNLDGVLTHQPRSDGRSIAYLQAYRSGVLETVSSALFLERERGVNLPSLSLARETAGFLIRAQRLMRALGVDPPASVFMSLLGARNATLGISETLRFMQAVEPHPFDRDNVLFRELALNDWSDDMDAILRPLLDELWQAAGLPRCFDYDNQGKWKPQR